VTGSRFWRVGVYVDIQNLYLTYKYQFGAQRIDYQVLKAFLERLYPEGVITFHAFTAYEEGRREQMSFILALAQIGYRVVSKPLKILPDGTKKGNLDMEIALEILNQAPHLDEIVLVTGDGDFVPLVNQLSIMGKRVTVLGPEGATAPDLILACHQFVSLGEVEGLYSTPNR